MDVHPDSYRLVRLLQSNWGNGDVLTLTAVHHGGRARAPSRHIPHGDVNALDKALSALTQTNTLGWHAYIGIAPRLSPLGRWRRGGQADITQIGALFADLDYPVQEAQRRIKGVPAPSLVVHSGRNTHLYWLLRDLTTDLDNVRRVLRGLAAWLGGDPHMTPSASLRLPGTFNLKPGGGLCRIVSTRPFRYTLADFAAYERTPTEPPKQVRIRSPSGDLNPRLIEVVLHHLTAHYDAYPRKSGWIAARCPCGHARDRPGQHFAFNPALGYGHCFGRHGGMNLTALCDVLGIRPADHGGIYLTDT